MSNMNYKTVLGLAVALIGLGVVFVFVQPNPPVPLPISVAMTTTASSTTSPAISHMASSTPQKQVFSFGTTTGGTRKFASFNTSSLRTSSAYPTLSGTANVPTVAIIISTSAGVGLVGAGDIPVKQGRWSYSTPVHLDPGNYVVLLVGGASNTAESLTILNP